MTGEQTEVQRLRNLLAETQRALDTEEAVAADLRDDAVGLHSQLSEVTRERNDLQQERDDLQAMVDDALATLGCTRV